MGTNYSQRVAAYRKYLQDTDASLAMCMTDVKGDRGLHPSKQKDHQDYYLHIVDENKDGIVIRGAKAHISFAAACHELMVLPCRAMTEDDKDYAVSCGVPLNAKGVTIISTPPEIPHAQKGSFDFPLGGGLGGDAIIVFDDVFVPNERVFLKKEWRFAVMQTYMFSNFHRMTADAYKYPIIQKFVGCAMLIAEYNGIERYGHVRDKISWLVKYAETTEALGRLACELCVSEADSDLVYPKPMLSNLAKLYFAENSMESIQHMMDLAGGIMATMPREKDFKNPVTGPMLQKYLRGKAEVPTEYRVKAINLAKALCGEFEQIASLNAEGSMASQRLQIYGTAPFQEWKELAKKMAGIPIDKKK
jgi:4-hydroxybutyryl-CoA dehydratase/vinylacetyl-CoA-Delta-isomerase